MARNLQRLIHFHGTTKAALDTSASSLHVGEIAVVYNSDKKQSYLAINTLEGGDSSKLVYFISSGAVYDAIVTLSDAIDTNTTQIESKIDTLSASTVAIESGLTAISGLAQTIKASAHTAPVTNEYISASTAVTSAEGEDKEVTIGVTLDVAEDLSSVTADTKQVANAKAVVDYVKSVSGNIESEIDERSTQIENLIHTKYNSACTYTNSAITELKETVIDDIKKNLSDVYTFKGSVNSYDLLPDPSTYESGELSGRSGDVYNVIAASGVPGTADYVAAGTNFAFVPEDSGTTTPAHWDALGGTIDLSAYATSAETAEAITGAVEAGKNAAIASAISYTNSAITDLNMGQYITESSAATAIENAIIEAVSDANDYTDDAISALSATVKSTYWTSAETQSKIEEIQSAAGAKLDDVSGYSKNAYIVVENQASETAGTEQVQTRLDKIGIELQVESLTAVTESGKVADAKDVKDYVDTQVDTYSGAALVAASALVVTEKSRAEGIEESLGSRIGALESGVTMASAVTAVEFASLEPGEGVAGAAAGSDVHNSGVNARILNKTLQLDFDSLIIDCGTFGND